MAELLVVPTRGTDTVALRSGHLPSGERVGIAFTNVAHLIEAMGPDQPWIEMDAKAIKAMLAPLGIEHLQIDPVSARPGGTRVRSGLVGVGGA